MLFSKFFISHSQPDFTHFRSSRSLPTNSSSSCYHIGRLEEAEAKERTLPREALLPTNTMGTPFPPQIRGSKAEISRVVSRIFNLIARLLAWYTLYTILCQCPSELTDSSPTICHAYGKFRDVVSPRLGPYYNIYASPYVEKYSPHINEAYLYPVLESASAGYRKYAQPHISKARAVVEKQYEKELHPHVSKVENQVKQWYGQRVGPYFIQLNDQYRAVITSPVWKSAQGHAVGMYKATISPAYARVSPYLEKGLANGKHVTLAVVVPHTKDGLGRVYRWFHRTAWSKIRELWQQYVEIQVGRIRSKLSSNSSPRLLGDQHNRRVKPIPDNLPDRKAARKQIEEDLARWTEKLEVAANEAISNLSEEIDRIAISAMDSKKPIVDQQLKTLDKQIENNIRALKAKITNIAKSYLPNNVDKGKSKTNAFDELFQATKDIGQSIKDSVQNIRWDSQRFIAKVYDEVAAATDSRMEVIDALVDEGIQELGTKWDWGIPGVSHTEWARYDDLKKEFAGIRTKVLKSAEKNNKLKQVTNWAEGEQWEGGAVVRAKAAVDELARLKRIGKQKIESRDSTEDFSDKYISKAEQESTENVLANKKVEDDIFDLTDRVPPSAAPATSSMSEGVDSTYSKISFGLANAASVADALKVDYEEEDALADALVEKMRNSADETMEKLKHASRAVSEAIYGTRTTQLIGESISSIASEKYESALKAASRALYPPTPATDQIVGIATDKYSAAVEAASGVIYGTPTPWYQSAYDAYQDATKSAADKYRDVIHSAEIAVSGAPQPAHQSVLSVAQEKYSSAMFAAEERYSQAISTASTAIYGTPKPAHESIASVASEKFAAATSSAEQAYFQLSRRASAVLLGTPLPLTESVASKVGQYAAKMTDAADARLEKVEALISELVYGKEPDFTESVMKRFNEILHSRVPKLAEQATSVVAEHYGSASNLVAKSIPTITPPPVLEDILHEASEKMRIIVEAASIQAYGTTKGQVEKVSSAIGGAYEGASSKVSEAIYGRETGAFESATSKIAEAASAASKMISEAVYGTPTPEPGSFDSVTSAMGEKFDSVTSVISERIEVAQSHVSRAIYGPEYEKIIVSAQGSLSESVEKAKKQLEEIYGRILEKGEAYGEKAGREGKEAKSSVRSVIDQVTKVVVVDKGGTTTGKTEGGTGKVESVYSSVKDEL